MRQAKDAISLGKKMKNKANFKMGKIDVSSSLTSEYNRIQGILDKVWQENKANSPAFDRKYEILISKFETISNFQKPKTQINIGSLKTV